MLFRFQWHIDKFALGVGVGAAFISTSPLNNAKRLSSQKELLIENPLVNETRQNTINTINLETQLTSHNSIQHLEVDENKDDDANCKKSGKEAHFISEK